MANIKLSKEDYDQLQEDKNFGQDILNMLEAGQKREDSYADFGKNLFGLIKSYKKKVLKRSGKLA